MLKKVLKWVANVVVTVPVLIVVAVVFSHLYALITSVLDWIEITHMVSGFLASGLYFGGALLACGAGLVSVFSLALMFVVIVTGDGLLDLVW